MLRNSHYWAGVSLTMVCILVSGPVAAKARDETPVRLYATAESGPIGTIYSVSQFAIERRLARGEETIWGGELIQAQPDSRVIVRLDSIGQVTLMAGAVVRFAATRRFCGNSTHRLLVASLVSGDLVVSLDRDAGAYIEASGWAFTTSDGANFKVATRNGRAMIDVTSGEVKTELQATQRSLKIRLVEPNPDPLKPPIDLGLRLDVERRATRETQWQVTDEHDKPVPDIPLILAVAGNIGRFGNAATFTGTTNPQGIVSAQFTAAPAPGEGTISANIPGTNVSAEARVRVKSKSTSMRNRILIGAAAVIATTVVIIKITDNGPIEQAPPPTVIP
jgi:hypothetical protein